MLHQGQEMTSLDGAHTILAGHRALGLPEIISNIVRQGAAFRGLLYSMLLVNRLFYHETVHILWHGCGHNSPTVYDHVTPNIDDLVTIVRRNRSRAQSYANLIHHLVFNEAEPDDLLRETTFHRELGVLRFPRLEEVVFLDDGTSTASLNTGDVVIYYAQPNVSEFGLMGGSEISNGFLDELARCCPKLRWLTIHTINNSVTEAGLVRFLQSSSLLDFFDVRESFADAWTLKAFQALFNHPKMEMAFIPFILDTWIEQLRIDAHYKPVLPALKHLQTRISSDSLALLSTHAANVDSLFLELQRLPPSHNILISAAMFPKLTDLVISFSPDSIIRGAHLLSLVRGCPGLSHVHISERDSHDGSAIPSGLDVSDSTFHDMTLAMPNIKLFCIFLEPPALLSHLSLSSFGRHCRKLEFFNITCNCDWREMVKEVAGVSFPAMESMGLSSRWGERELGLGVGGGHDDDDDSNDDDDDDDDEMKRMSQLVGEMMPVLRSFSIDDGNDVDAELVRRMMAIIVGREGSCETESDALSL